MMFGQPEFNSKPKCHFLLCVSIADEVNKKLIETSK